MMFEADPPKKIASKVVKTKDEVRFKEDLKSYGDMRTDLETRIGQLQAGVKVRCQTEPSDCEAASPFCPPASFCHVTPSCPCIQALELITAPEEVRVAFETQLKEAQESLSTLPVPDLDDYVEEEKIIAYPDPHDKWMKLKIPTSVETVDDMVNFFKTQHGLTMQNWSMSKRDEDGKVTGAALRAALACLACLSRPCWPLGGPG